MGGWVDEEIKDREERMAQGTEMITRGALGDLISWV